MKTLPCLFLLLSLPPSGFALDDKEIKLPSDENEVRVSRGLRYSVPKDWPMDERNGGISPVPTEEYVLMKFKKIDARLAALEAQLNQKSAEAPIEAKKIPETTMSRLKSLEYKPATLVGEDTKNEKALS